MQHVSLENTLHVRAFMLRNNMCCKDFRPTMEMLSLFTKGIAIMIVKIIYIDLPDIA